MTVNDKQKACRHLRRQAFVGARTNPRPLRNATLNQSGGPENGAMNAL
jgi:hypothetical protein